MRQLVPKSCLQASPNLLEVDRIIIPMNIMNTHWVLIMIDIKNKRFVYYDSNGVS